MMDAKVLYIAGNEGSGKSPVCRNIDNLLQNKGFDKKRKQTLNDDDYVIYRTRNGEHVVLSTASDNADLIAILESFIESIFDSSNDAEVIVLVLAIRNTGDPMRKSLENLIKEHFNIIEEIEIPLARINDNAGLEVHDWYHEAVDKLVKHVLESNPFNL